MRDASLRRTAGLSSAIVHILLLPAIKFGGLRTGQSGSLGIRLGDDVTIETLRRILFLNGDLRSIIPPPEPSLATTLLLR